MKRVVVTGLGMITPFGRGVQHNWDKLLGSNCAISSLVFDDFKDISAKVAAQVPRGDLLHQFNDNLIPSQVRSGCSDFIKYAIIATQDAIKDSKLDLLNNSELQERTGIYIGSGVGALGEITSTYDKVKQGGINKASAYFIPRILINEASGIISILEKIRGPNLSVVSACATGAHAIGESYRKIKYGEVDAMVCGGTEASITPLSMIGFSRMKALSTKYNDCPERASRPFDEGRDGFVMGEGSGVLVLEELEHALKRNATIYCEIVGYGATGDSYHISAPEPSGDGAKRAMSLALKEANVSNPLKEVGYINAHSTSTPLGDVIECKAVIDLFSIENNNHYTSEQEMLAMTSNKSAIGHLLGAAGSVESIFSIMSLKSNLIPPNLNLEQTTPHAKGINLVKSAPLQKSINMVIKNSFGFGGTNASLVFKKFNQ